MVLEVHRGNYREKPAPHRDHLATKENSGLKRQKFIEKHFPATIFRMRNSQTLSPVISSLLLEGFALPIIEQAICNLVLSSREMSGELHLGSTSQDDAAQIILNHLRNHTEDSKSSFPEEALTKPVIKEQIRLDLSSLLEFHNVSLKKNSAEFNMQTATSLNII